MIKIGIIGAGFMGNVHAACYELLAKKKDLKVTAVADADFEKAEKIACKFGAKVFSSGKELIEYGDLSVVDICLQTDLHAEYGIMAMEKGLHVFIEKPVCMTEEQAVMLEDAKRKTAVRAAVGHCLRFWPEYMYLKKLADSKGYGEITSAVFKRISPKPSWSWDNWLIDGKRSGSAALDLHVHDVDFVRYILGVPEVVKSEMVPVNGNNEHIFSLYRYDNAIVSIEAGWDYPTCMPFVMEYRVNFENATIIFDSTKTPCLAVYTNAGEILHPSAETEFFPENQELGGNLSNLAGYFNELNYFLNCLENGEEIKDISLEEGIESFRLTAKGIKAALIGSL